MECRITKSSFYFVLQYLFKIEAGDVPLRISCPEIWFPIFVFGSDSVVRIIRTAKSTSRSSRSNSLHSFDIHYFLFDILNSKKLSHLMFCNFFVLQPIPFIYYPITYLDPFNSSFQQNLTKSTTCLTSPLPWLYIRIISKRIV